MSAIIQPDALTGFNFFVEGAGQGGKIKALPLPDLEFSQESHQAGVMFAPINIDQGLEPLMLTGAEFVGAMPVLLKSFRHRTVDGLGLRCQGSYKAPGETREKPLIATFRGKWTKQAHEKFEVKKNGGLTADASLVYYKLEYDGEVIHDINILTGVAIIDGVDVFAARNQNLGV